MAIENPQPASFTPTDFRDRMMGGTFWVAASQVLVQGVRFIGLLVLVRLLSPGDFGLVAMCFVVMGVTAIFTEMGLPNALIQARELTAIQKSSTAWVFLSLAVAMAGIVILAAPLFSSLFNEPRIGVLLRVFSFGFIINALAVVPDAVLRRNIRFKEVGAAAAALAVVCFAAWAWNSAAAVTNWAGPPAADARVAFSTAVITSVGADFVKGVEVAAATVYLAGLAYVLVAMLPGRRATGSPTAGSPVATGRGSLPGNEPVSLNVAGGRDAD